MKIYKITKASKYLGMSANTLKTFANIGTSLLALQMLFYTGLM